MSPLIQAPKCAKRSEDVHDYLVYPRADHLPAWHLVGGKDLIDAAELSGREPDDGYSVLLPDWIKSDGLTLMVQDLTNPVLAQIPHVLLAAHAGTIMGVETNAMQFYPKASKPEAEVHPGLYQRRNGRLDLSTLKGAGFGYRVEEIERTLPEPVACFEE